MSTDVADEKKPTLGDYAAQAGNDPWACPRCGCRGPHDVESTYWLADRSRRRRYICRNCGQGLIRSIEVPDAPKAE